MFDNSLHSLLQGLFSRITFNQPVFIGGSGTTRNVKNFLGVDNGIQACVRHLEINDKLYNLKPSSQGGDIIGGLDISKKIRLIDLISVILCLLITLYRKFNVNAFQALAMTFLAPRPLVSRVSAE